MSHAITLIAGDGIGPEVVRATVDIIAASGVKVSWDEQPLGLEAIKQCGQALGPNTIESIKKNNVALKGPTTTPIGGGHRSANVSLRKELDLYACIRPIKTLPGVESRFSDVDLVVVRENTEGLYVGQEIEVQPGCVVSLRTMTSRGCTRIAKKAFEYAQLNNRNAVCVAHKANILKLGDGLFLQCIKRVSDDYPKIKHEEVIIDALCMMLVLNPKQFDVLLLENMFGDIVSDLCAGLVGGLGVVPGANIGDHCAVFEAVHGSALDIAGQNIANPTAMIQSAVMMLKHIGENSAAEAISKALYKVLEQRSLRTKDLGGNALTKEFSHSVIKNL